MGKNRGIRLGRKLAGVFKRFICRRRPAAYRRIDPAPMSRLCRWARSVRRAARRLCSGSGYVQLGKKQEELPKGHLAVYVGDREDDTCRVLVPVIYFNHPLFGELLREAEKVYGFDHPGGIQIPCPKSELEKVQMKIAAACGGGIWRS